MVWQLRYNTTYLWGWGRRCDPVGLSEIWDKDIPSEGMKAKVSRKCHAPFFAWTARTRSIINVLFILYFAWDPEAEPEPEPEPESIRSPESKSEQPHTTTPHLCLSFMLGYLKTTG